MPGTVVRAARRGATGLFRSCLFTPGDRPSAITKALTNLSADVVIIDLEDAVSASKKVEARQTVVSILSSKEIMAKKRCSTVAVRINCHRKTPYGADDLEALSQCQYFDAVILPKVECADAVQLTASRIIKQREQIDSNMELPLGLWCMIETARGVQNVDTIAHLKQVDALIFGSNDLTKDLRARHTPAREPLLYAMSRVIMGARANGLPVVDGVHLTLSDDQGLRHSCVQGRSFGFDGKSLIHPSQIEVANECFSPSTEELAEARKIVASYEAAAAQGKAVCVVDDRLVEELHVEQALRLIREASEIKRLEQLRKDL